ncbi:hypothetical protein ABT352_23075 [Streptosporangium sp. NPDC000563]|uniref:hypothetical protein n=1 Tax=Streptosporangium sp. NPDC000563 TaxID=3154366 RepID=UPI00331F4598
MPHPGMRRRVQAIPGTPMPNGLLGGCTTILDVEDPHELLGVDWISLSCKEAHPTDWCPTDDAGNPLPAPGPKTFERPDSETAGPVTIYAGAVCSAPGFSYAEAEQHARAGLSQGEGRALEEWFWRDVLAPKAVDRTPAAGPVSVTQGIAILEGWLAADYGGVGVIHVPAGAAALLGRFSQLMVQGSRLRTWLGNCVVLGAGYAVNTGPDGTPAPAGQAWLYASGPVVVRRGPVDVIPGQAPASVNIRNNDRLVLAERTFVPSTTCAVEAVLVDLCLCCP